MKNKEAYIKKLHAKIDEWNAEFDRLKAKADQVETDSKIEYQKQIQDLFIFRGLDAMGRWYGHCRSLHRCDDPARHSGIDIEVAWWTESLPVDIRRSRAEIVTAVKSALDDAGIEIPFPYRTMTFKNSLRTKRIDAGTEIKEEQP